MEFINMVKRNSLKKVGFSSKFPDKYISITVAVALLNFSFIQ